MSAVGASEELEEYDIDGNDVITYSTSGGPVEESDPFAEEADFAKSLSYVAPNRKRSITNMQKRMEGRGKAGTKRIEDDIITGYNAFEVVLPPYNLDYLAKLYEMSSPHYSACNAKVSNIVGLGYDFVESNLTKRTMDAKADDKKWLKRKRKQLNQVRDELKETMDDLNKEDTFIEVLTKVWKDYEATGNGYIEIGRTAGGDIGYIGHVPATTMRIRRERDGFVQIIANKAVFFRNLGSNDKNPVTNDRNPNEVIHIKKYSPSSTYYGVPDIISAKQAVAGNEFAARFNLDYFENKAVPRHVITLKGATINPKLAKNILEFFETGLKGKNHRSLFIPLPGDNNERKVELDIEPIETGIQDSSFNNYRKQNLNEILMSHRVPISKIGLAEGVSLAVARDADKTFKEQVCRPEQRILEKKLNRIIAEFTDLFVLKLNEMTLTDEDTMSKIHERYLKTGAIMRNEVRQDLGRSSIPEGDTIIDMNDKGGAENRAKGNRQRDSERSANATDSAGEGRNEQGEGRTGS